ncbi:Glyoxylase, beta-lactamase superfamily II [Ferrimonas sediminum]|uniref:Glyoxylase, beta-lactamase superfamily II n=1 Tax=Ferrimonas sediminum TaxID=718193 RepID=A0A1G8NVV8_9GAMM|nr:MBL fold metallo-hydrolase [Ferrimonas sediminum]SDI84323.1 Glyoxylase, beta-lactamase superfamily II [Ferrimonas sediminum]
MRKLLLLTLIFALPASGDDRFKDIEIVSQEVAQGVYMLTGSGGNIGVSAGDDGILIIDDQFAPLADRIAAALTAINPKPVKYLLNTHYHGDHIGGNAEFASQATIFAHHNVRLRLAQDSSLTPAHLPVVTYSDGITIHFNGDRLRVVHLPSGHTDGDSLVRFERANVVHMGDLFFKDTFPYVDLKGGGSVEGYLNNVTTALGWMDDDTKVIPGHGGLATKADMQKFQEMLLNSITWARKQPMDASLQQWQAAFPESLHSWSWRFITTERWVTTLYEDKARIHD